MPVIEPRTRALLIGGTSHAGKSMSARLMSVAPNCTCVSTDYLARHPGRPWADPPRTVPAHVAEHYRTLSPEELLADVLRHYGENVWPQVLEIVDGHVAGPSCDVLVVEGSAVWPEFYAASALAHRPEVQAFWVTAPERELERRIRINSRYAERTLAERGLIDRFIARTLLYNERMLEAVDRLGLVCVSCGEPLPYLPL
jgi:hypothetical protein